MDSNIQEKIENKVIDWIAIGASGRLVAIKPEKGPDLLVEKKGDYPIKQVSLYIKTDFNENISKDGWQKDSYILFVVFDKISQKLEDKFWMVPASKIAGKVFTPKDFSEFQTNPKSFCLFLIDKL